MTNCSLKNTKVTENSSDKSNKSSKLKVFIVHGHDEKIKSKVVSFLKERRIEPIILEEQASSGNTIIEKIEQYSEVALGIILYTPCDLGNSIDEKEAKKRARQNVVFEHGYLIGKLGRSRVFAILTDDEIERPSDISGIIYIKMDSQWKNKILEEINTILKPIKT